VTATNVSKYSNFQTDFPKQPCLPERISLLMSMQSSKNGERSVKEKLDLLNLKTSHKQIHKFSHLE